MNMAQKPGSHMTTRFFYCFKKQTMMIKPIKLRDLSNYIDNDMLNMYNEQQRGAFSTTIDTTESISMKRPASSI